MIHQASVYQDLHTAIQERTQYGGGGTASSRIAEQKRTQDTRDNLKKATRVLLEVTKKQEDALKKHIQRAADPNDFRGMVYPYQLIPEEERTKINDAIHGYYSLKEKYNSALEKRRQRLINDPVMNWKTLSAQQKAKRLSMIKPMCIVCKQDGGSIFTETDGKLKAICGNISQPCGFHIEVNRGKYISLETLMNESLEEVRATKDEIIRMKLDLLFQFINEDELLAQFDAVQHKLQEQMKMYTEFRTYYLSVTDNDDRRKDTATHTRVIAERIAQIKEYMTEFRESEWKNRSIIDDILVLYQQDIEPAFLKLRETKYVYSQVETTENAEGALVQMYNDGEFNLSQKQYSYHELYMPVIMPKWIADNRIVSSPVGAVVAPKPGGGAAAAR
ncbi:MAG: hypothetical protein EBU66_16370 [Bacteroidetes bacterium]|nr:hypothetical protein [bacterium]NBP66212.1 hypothetical protein [Bacteroidota bacterium]